MKEKKQSGSGSGMYSHRLSRELMERLRVYLSGLRPRVSETALLEDAILEYLERHEKEQETR